MQPNWAPKNGRWKVMLWKVICGMIFDVCNKMGLLSMANKICVHQKIEYVPKVRM